MIIKVDCRNCSSYKSSRDNEVESVLCKEGYFNYKRYKGGKVEGKMPDSALIAPPCDGKYFVLDESPNSRWSMFKNNPKYREFPSGDLERIC